MNIHIVQKGETLSTIAQAYEVENQLIMKENPQIASPHIILPGMKLKIPSSSYKIKRESTHLNADGGEKYKQGKKSLQNITTPPAKETQKGNVSSFKQKYIYAGMNKTDKSHRQQTKAEPPMEDKLSYQFFTPHKRMETDMQMDMKKQIREKPHPLHMAKIDAERKTFCCFHCHHPMQMERPLYFPMNDASKNHSNPYIPSTLLQAKPNDYLS